jgi:hypothetical protein
MDVKLHQCFLSVDDHDKAIAFYRDALDKGPSTACRRPAQGGLS